MDRSRLILNVVSRILSVSRDHPVRVGIDGIDASGKTTFAGELASAIEANGRQVIRGSIDSFHNPSSVRYRRGRESPKGYYFDSFNLSDLEEQLLRPLGPGGSLQYRRAMYDYHLDTYVDAPLETAEIDAVLVFDGVFLHRPELHGHWDFSVFLHVDFSVAISRAIDRHGDTSEEEVRRIYSARYLAGQSLYLSAVKPMARGSLVIDNNDPSNPAILGTA